MDNLRDRVAALLKRYAAATREQEGLKKEVSILRAENEDVRHQLKQAQDALLAARIGQAIPDEALRLQSRKKLDSVISEIDKILTSIND